MSLLRGGAGTAFDGRCVGVLDTVLGGGAAPLPLNAPRSPRTPPSRRPLPPDDGAGPALAPARSARCLGSLRALVAGGGLRRPQRPAPVGVFVAAATGEYEYVNERWCALAGMPASEALGDGWAAALHAEDAAAALTRWRERMESCRDGSFLRVPVPARLHGGLCRELRRMDRNGEYGALVLLDLDNFKTVNDTAGHLAGDQVLGATADVLRGRLRATDVIGRLGGDEFAALVLDVTTRQASEIDLRDGRDAALDDGDRGRRQDRGRCEHRRRLDRRDAVRQRGRSARGGRPGDVPRQGPPPRRRRLVQ